MLAIAHYTLFFQLCGAFWDVKDIDKFGIRAMFLHMLTGKNHE